MKELLAVLRNRNMAVLLSARFVSSSGDWLYAIALMIAVYQYSNHNSLFIGLFWIVRLIPNMVLGPYMGGLGDRMGHRRAMITADVVRTVLVAILALTLSASTWPIIYPVAFLVSSFGRLFRPASVALIPSIVSSREERLAANASIMQIEAIATILGTAVGGFVAGLGGITTLLLIEAATFAASAVSLLFVHPREPERRPVPVGPAEEPEATPEPDEAGNGFIAGIRLLTTRPELIFAAGVMVLPEFASGADPVWIVPYADQVLKLGGAGAGYLYAAYGIGSVAGGLVAAVLGGNIRLDRLLVLSVAAGGVATLCFGVFPLAAIALLCFLASGVAETVEYAAYETLLQQAIPEEVLGRATGTMDSLFFNMMLVGALVGSVMVTWPGLRPSIVGLGALIVAGAAVGWWRLRRQTAGRPDPATLAQIPAFSRVSPEIREWAVRRMAREEVPAGEVVIRQGEEGDKFYAIASGKAEVQVASDGQTLTRELGPGQFFGEIALLQHVPRTATVRAVDPLVLYTLDRESFQELQDRAGEFKESLLETATSRLAEDTNFKLALATRGE